MSGTPTRPRGVVLIVVLWVVAILAVVCLALGGTARFQQAHLKRSAAEVSCQQSLLGAAALGKALLLADSPQADTLADAWAGGDADLFALASGRMQVRLLAGSDQCGLEDESARLNANTATAEMLSKLPGMTAAAAEAFVAARQSAHQAGQTGLTGTYAAPAQLAEALVGALGEARVLSSAGALEPPAGGGQAGSWAGRVGLPPSAARLMQHLTVHTRQRNVDARGQPRTNINTASPAELAAATAGHFTAEQVEAVVAARADRPFQSIGELLTRTMEIPDEQGNPKTVRVGRTQLQPVADRLTATEADILPGLVNVHTAPAEVLRCLPGLTAAGVSAIITHRGGAAGDSSAGIGWLLDVLSDEAFAEVCSFVTTRSQQFRMRAEARPAAAGAAPAVGGYALAVLERDAGRCSVLFWLTWTQALAGED